LRFKRLPIIFALVLVLSTFFSSFVFAENNVKPNLVALGDSITFGYKLEANQTQASPNAFPNLIGNNAFNVTNLGIPGWTSGQLLAALNTDQFINAVKAADVVTLNIGNNDILQAADLSNIILTHTPVDPAVLLPNVQAAAAQLSVNLQAIITKIKTQNPTAPIIFYNLYNPFGESADQFFAYLHTIGEQIITSVNGGVINPFANVPGIYLADAYTKYNGHQADYISPAIDLIHPNLAGHQALAALANEKLSSLVPGQITVDLTPSTTEQTKDPVSINVSTTATKVLAMQWLAGSKTIDDFAAAGTDITDNKFQVTENGTYSVYVRDSKGAKTVKSITINNIKKEEPVQNNPTPTPTPTPTPNTGGTGHTLPNTATPMYNYLAVGLASILAGLGAMKIQQFRRRENS
jgi:lysophospholipase L1-like esterase